MPWPYSCAMIPASLSESRRTSVSSLMVALTPGLGSWPARMPPVLCWTKSPGW